MRIPLAAALLLIAAPAVARDDPPPPDPALQPVKATVMAEPVAMMIAAFDRNGDGLVDKAELAAGVQASFAPFDKGTGAIGYIAFADWAERWLGDRNAIPTPFEVDLDGDNRITLAELQERFATIFTRFDKDGSGTVSRAELLTIRMPAPQGRKRR